jgi:hypothetical protein
MCQDCHASVPGFVNGDPDISLDQGGPWRVHAHSPPYRAHLMRLNLFRNSPHCDDAEHTVDFVEVSLSNFCFPSPAGRQASLPFQGRMPWHPTLLGR